MLFFSIVLHSFNHFFVQMIIIIRVGMLVIGKTNKIVFEKIFN